MKLLAAHKRVELAEAWENCKPYGCAAFWATDKQMKKLQVGAYDH